MAFVNSAGQAFNPDRPGSGELENSSSVDSIPRSKDSGRFPPGMQAQRMEVWVNEHNERIRRLDGETGPLPAGEWRMVGYELGGRVSRLSNVRKLERKANTYNRELESC